MMPFSPSLKGISDLAHLIPLKTRVDGKMCAAVVKEAKRLMPPKSFLFRITLD